MSLIEFTLLSLSSLFVIIDPIALAPLFLAMTPTDSAEARVRMARLACVIAACVLVIFGVLGRWIFKYLGITLEAFQMAGSVVLFLIALDMLRAKRSEVKETDEEAGEAAVKEDVAVTPLAVPMLAGPGAISTTILLHNRASGWGQLAVLYLSVLLVCAASYFILRWSALHGARWISPIAMRVTTRLMGLLLAAIAFQFLLNAILEFKGKL